MRTTRTAISIEMVVTLLMKLDMYKYVRIKRKLRDNGSKFGAACFTFIETSSVVTKCFLEGMNTDIKVVFWVC